MKSHPAMTRLRRCLFFNPGDKAPMLAKGAASGADCVILDLEDGVAAEQKAGARKTIVEALSTHAYGRTEKLIRVNAVESGLAEEDIMVTAEGRPDGWVLPKVASTVELDLVAGWIAKAEKAYGIPEGQRPILALVETALGVANLAEIASWKGPLAALIFGAEDFVSDMGGVRTPGGREVFWAQSAVAVHAKAHGLQAIGPVWTAIDDLEGLVADARFDRSLGYTGKMGIHPKQLDPIQKAWAPSPEELESARALLTAFEQYQKAGDGAFRWQGKMADKALIGAARTVVDHARQAGLI